MTNIYKKYAAVQSKIEALEQDKKALRALLEKELPAEGVDNEVGTFSFSSRKKYTFSEETNKLEAELELAQEREKLLGTATFTETKILTVKLK